MESHHIPIMLCTGRQGFSPTLHHLQPDPSAWGSPSPSRLKQPALCMPCTFQLPLFTTLGRDQEGWGFWASFAALLGDTSLA